MVKINHVKELEEMIRAEHPNVHALKQTEPYKNMMESEGVAPEYLITLSISKDKQGVDGKTQYNKLFPFSPKKPGEKDTWPHIFNHDGKMYETRFIDAYENPAVRAQTFIDFFEQKKGRKDLTHQNETAIKGILAAGKQLNQWKKNIPTFKSKNDAKRKKYEKPYNAIYEYLTSDKGFGIPMEDGTSIETALSKELLRITVDAYENVQENYKELKGRLAELESEVEETNNSKQFGQLMLKNKTQKSGKIDAIQTTNVYLKNHVDNLNERLLKFNNHYEKTRKGLLDGIEDTVEFETVLNDADEVISRAGEIRQNIDEIKSKYHAMAEDLEVRAHISNLRDEEIVELKKKLFIQNSHSALKYAGIGVLIATLLFGGYQLLFKDSNTQTDQKHAQP